MVKKLRDSVEKHIKKKNEQYVTIANKGHRQVIFELGIGFGCIYEKGRIPSSSTVQATT